MIQRIQTVYLLLAVICMALVLVFPVFSLSIVTEFARYENNFGAYGFVAKSESGILATHELPVYIIFIFLALLSLIPVFLYKNRKRQLIFSRISLAFHILVGVAFFSAYYVVKPMILEQVKNTPIETADLQWTMALGFYLLIAPIGFLFLANRGIKNDDKLVKSLDRLR